MNRIKQLLASVFCTKPIDIGAVMPCAIVPPARPSPPVAPPPPKPVPIRVMAILPWAFQHAVKEPVILFTKENQTFLIFEASKFSMLSLEELEKLARDVGGSL